jgi:RNA polymerase sigma-70 factor (ECF subfamily)
MDDRQAFEQFYRKTSSHLLGVILRIEPDRGHAEEILQEVFVNVWRAAGSFNAGLSQPMTWLVSIARHRAIDGLRRDKGEPSGAVLSLRPSTNEEGEEDDPLAHIPSEASGPLALLEEAFERQAVGQCMQTLSARSWQCLALAYYEGLSHAELAEHLRAPLCSVKSWVRRSLQALRECLERLAPGMR